MHRLDARLQVRAAPEGEQLLRQRAATVGGAFDFVGVAAPGLVVDVISEQQLGVSEDAREQVVEVVRDAARDTAQ